MPGPPSSVEGPPRVLGCSRRGPRTPFISQGLRRQRSMRPSRNSSRKRRDHRHLSELCELLVQRPFLPLRCYFLLTQWPLRPLDHMAAGAGASLDIYIRPKVYSGSEIARCTVLRGSCDAQWFVGRATHSGSAAAQWGGHRQTDKQTTRVL